MISRALLWFCAGLASQSAVPTPAPRLIVLFFTAPWCEPCRAVHPVLEKFARKHEDTVQVVEVDFEREKAESQRWAVRDIPVVIVLSDRGELLLRVDGASRQTLLGLGSDLEELVKKSGKRSSHEP